MKTFKKITTSAFLLLTFATLFAGTYKEKSKTAKTKAPSEQLVEAKEGNTVQIALLLDTSNSMDGLINQAKSQLWDIVNEFSLAKCGNKTRPKLQIALYQYGNDNLSVREGYIQQVLGFSDDLDEISEKLFSLTTNGGEEYCGKVIQTSLQQLPWSKNPDQLRMVFIAGNEPFDQGRYHYTDALANAKEKDIVVNTIYCGDFQQGVSTFWKNGAAMTGGEYMAIDHNRELVQISTPYDEVIIKLNARLNKTYISYGAFGKSKLMAQSVQDQNAMAMQEVVAVKRAVSKSSRLYNNKNWDLVDAIEDSEFEIKSIERDKLPAELQDKTEAEIKNYVQRKKNEREKIQKEIQELSRKRKDYVRKNRETGTKGELENAMLKAIKKQAALKNYSWE